MKQWKDTVKTGAVNTMEFVIENPRYILTASAFALTVATTPALPLLGNSLRLLMGLTAASTVWKATEKGQGSL